VFIGVHFLNIDPKNGPSMNSGLMAFRKNLVVAARSRL